MTTDDWRTEPVIALSEAIASLSNAEEVAGLLRDLCTRREITEMASRWQIVRLLDSGLSYRDIAQQTGASTATVTRVSQWFHHGTGGYQLALNRQQEDS
jgi:TrpR-related protein YerC/YecD